MWLAMPPDSGRPRLNISRRELLRRAALAGVAAVVPPRILSAQTAAPREPLETLSAIEADTLEAMVARLIPTDANGPGAAEARAAHYIDRALGGALASSREAYRTGLADVDRYARASKAAAFSSLTAADQDAVLRDMESLDYQAIADVLAVPIGTVRSRLHRARLALKELLQDRLSCNFPEHRESKIRDAQA